MLRLPLHILGTLLVLSGSPALAFEETKQKVAPTDQGAALAGKDNAKPPLNLDGTGTSIESSPPSAGLGKLGIWPKLDFGLELLYGGRDNGKPDEADRRLDAPDGVQIRGHIKHRW